MRENNSPVTLSRSSERSEEASEGSQGFFAEPVLSVVRFFATLRMTHSKKKLFEGV